MYVLFDAEIEVAVKDKLQNLLDDVRKGLRKAKITYGGLSATKDAVRVQITEVAKIEDARTFLSEAGIDVDRLAPQVEGRFASAFIRASKPASCCGPTCCS